MVSFFLALLTPSGAAVWLRAGGEVGASDGMIAVVMSRVLAFRRPRDFLSGARELCDCGLLDEGLGADTLVLGVLRSPRNDPPGTMERGGRG